MKILNYKRKFVKNNSNNKIKTNSSKGFRQKRKKFLINTKNFKFTIGVRLLKLELSKSNFLKHKVSKLKKVLDQKI